MTLVGKRSPFELYTVGPSEEILTMTGGLKVRPNYSIANAPQPKRHRRSRAARDGRNARVATHRGRPKRPM